jgi:hypothetical protein
MIEDRVFETSSTTGTGTLALDGPQTGYVSFATAIGNGKKCIYIIDAEGQSFYEIGVGTVVTGSPNTLQRTTPLKSSNSDNAVNLPSGTKRVYIPPFADLFVLCGEISPSQITANQNDYAPTGNAGATVWRLTSNASRNITGISNGAEGRVLILHNVGANDLVLVDESASSTAANRFALAGDLTIHADEAATLWYDETSSRWRVSGSNIALPSASDTVAGAIEIAIQSEMETGTDATRAVTPGRQHFHPSAAKWWAKWDNAGSISASYNTSSVTDNGTGSWDPNIGNDMSSANWAAFAQVLVAADAARSTVIRSQGSSVCRVLVFDSTPALVDGSAMYAGGLGDL